MRELKFKMITQTTGKLLGYVDIYELLRNGQDVLPDLVEAILKGVKFEQYTGLKDKNGKEIYEGDIVGDIEGIHELAICVWDDSNAEFDFVCVDGKCTKDNVKSWLEMYEIIGNIHENRELLRGKEC